MMWYYALNGKQAGPVSEADLRGLAARGTIDGSTLVWREGMDAWAPYAEAVPPAGDVGATAGTAVPGHAACRECGRRFPVSEMIPFGDAHVCAACKPRFLQKISEGVAVPVMNYAGFWIRFAAAFIDGIILWVVNTGLSFAVQLAIMTGGGPEAQMAATIVTFLLNTAISTGYEVFFVGRYAATPGKMALGLRIVRSDGSRVSYMRALGRHFAEYISAMILFIGYIMVAFDQEKRALHDHICDTRVIGR